MKKILFVLLMFQSAIVFSQNNIKIKIEQKDGSFLTYNLSDISEINFKEYSLSSICNIYIKPDSVFSILNYKITKIAIKKGINDNDSLSVTFYYNLVYKEYGTKTLNFPLNIIDSISFINTNKLFGRVYSNININIQGLTAQYKMHSYKYPPGQTDSSFSTENFNKSIDLKNNFFLPNMFDALWGCEKCFNKNRMGDLYYCFGNENSNGVQPQTCNITQIYLFIDTLNQIIDSLIYSYDGKNYSHSEGSYNQNINYYERIKLHSIPFTIQSDGTIVANFKIDDLSKFFYAYQKDNYDGNYAIYTSYYSTFTQFLPPFDSATISIVIKE